MVLARRRNMITAQANPRKEKPATASRRIYYIAIQKIHVPVVSFGTQDLSGDVLVTQGIIVIPSTTSAAGMVVQERDGMLVPIITGTEMSLLLLVERAIGVEGVAIGTTSRGTDGSVGPITRIAGGGGSVDIGFFHLVVRDDSGRNVMDSIVRRLEGVDGELL